MIYLINKYCLSIKICAGIFLTFLITAYVHAEDMERLLKDRGCVSCHAMTETFIGPPYQAIALLHQDRKDIMLDVLAHKIIVGGAGNWGLVPMVPSEQVTEKEARKMAEWILNLKPGE